MRTLTGLVLGLLISAGAQAAAPPTNPEWAYFQSRNLVVNPGAEQGQAGWVSSGGTFSVNTTAANVGSGAAAFSWDSSAAAQTLTSQAVTIPAGLFGRNAALTCNLKCASGTCTHTLAAYDGTTAINPTTITSSSTYARTTLNLVAPSSGTLAVQVKSVASNEPQLFIDDCILADASLVNISQVNQAQFIGSAYFPSTTSCQWSRSGTTFGDFSTDTDCPGPTVEFNPGPGTISTTDSDLPQITVSNLPPGFYQIIASFTDNNLGASVNTGYRINDGVTSSGATERKQSSAGSEKAYGNVVATFNYTTAQASRTFKMQSFASSGNAELTNSDTVSGGEQLTFRIYRFPSSPEQVFRPDSSPASWSGYHDNTCAWTTSSTSFVDPSDDGSCGFTEIYNRNFGTVSSFGSKGPGISFTPPRVGRYLACINAGIAAATSLQMYAQVYDGTNDLGQFGKSNGGSQTHDSTQGHCFIYNAASTSAANLRLRLRVSSGTGTLNNVSGASTERAVQWSITELDAAMPTPFLVGSVTSSSTGSERIERLSVSPDCTSSPCTIASKSSEWVSSTGVTRTGTGLYTVTYAGFSSTPTCQVITFDTSGAGPIRIEAQSSTAMSFKVFDAGFSGSLSDGGFNVICMGAR